MALIARWWPIWVLCGAAVAILARFQGRNPAAWFFVGAVLGPLGALVFFLTAREIAPREQS